MRAALQGWSSFNIRLDPYAAQISQQPTQFQKIHNAIMRVARDPAYQPQQAKGGDGNGNDQLPGQATGTKAIESSK